ncbi:AI-2E family transporter [Sphingomonas sp. KRR8]|uniref:AI-2E family transporter n=1 Tax=Sphingomonas sp. KRR8 TaxID=2942996 RepID=UPI0020202ABA|nr:AI-2E family transporter [Sphingomonas sp. KRR8]URD61990.1 AI-2E family transporter [Sphingomonas sp. KRR8]
MREEGFRPPPITPGGLRARQMLLVGLVLALAAWVAYEFLVPLAWAAVLAIAEWPLFARARRRWGDHDLLLAVMFAALTALIVLVPLSVAGVSLAQESQSAADWVAKVQRSGLAPPPWLSSIPVAGQRLQSAWQQHLGTPQGANALLGSLSATSVLEWTRSVGGMLARELGMLLITLIALVSLLSRGEQIRCHADNIADGLFGSFGKHFLGRMIEAVRGVVNGTAIVSFGEGAIIGVGYFVAGVPQPLLFTVFTILLALVPFGAWAAFGFASLILIGTGAIWAGILLFAFGVAVMTVGDNVVQPSVIGSAVELPFLMAMIGAFGGLAEMGLVGLFVGPVIMAALLLVWREWIKPRAEESSAEARAA